MADHNWEHVYFNKFTWCTFCGEFIWGIHKKQGYRCKECKGCAHGKCRANAGPCPGLDVHKDNKKGREPPAGATEEAPPQPDRQAPSKPNENLEKSTYTPLVASNGVARTPEPVSHAVAPIKHQARALFDFPPENTRELELKAGDVIEVLKVDEEWWFGVLQNGNEGYFPGNYVEKIGNW